MRENKLLLTQGDRIRGIFERCTKAMVIAPFIKVEALKSILGAIPSSTPVKCVTRWLPKEVASGVSDPEIFDLLSTRGNFELTLVDQLHAKLYVSDQRCLAGSVNVTNAGFGESEGGGNTELLVETDVNDVSVLKLLEEISENERQATKDMAFLVRELANRIPSPKPGHLDMPNAAWIPTSLRPANAYLMYSGELRRDSSKADQVVYADLAMANLPPGLSENDFRGRIRSLLSELSVVKLILGEEDDKIYRQKELDVYFEEYSSSLLSSDDLWRSFIEWMAHFYPDKVMKQEVTEYGLRRAKLINGR